MRSHLGLSAVLTALSAGLFFVFNFVIAGFLEPEAFGEIQYYVSFTQLISLSFSLNYASLYMGSRIGERDERTLSLFLTAQSALFLVVLAPLTVLLILVIGDAVTIILLLASSYMFVMMTSCSLEHNAASRIAASILTGTLGSRVLLLAFFSSLAVLGFRSPRHFLYAYFASFAVMVLVSIVRFRPRTYLSLALYPRAWKFFVLGIIGRSFTYVAQILQKELFGFAELAVLSISLLMLMGLSIWGSLLIKFVLPILHELWSRRDYPGIAMLYSSNTRLEVITVLPVYLALLFNIDRIAEILGSSYSLLPAFFYILSVGFFLHLTTGVTGTILRATEYESLEVGNEIARLVVGLGMLFLLRGNTYGVAIAISASMVVYNAVKLGEVVKLFKMVPLTRSHLIEISAFSVVAVGLLFGASTLSSLPAAIGATLVCLAALYVYGARQVLGYVKLLEALRVESRPQGMSQS